ncbi:ABC transporter substrate-binding protein [Paenibacillus daejeonensis]|uniref:ABC transporter substrate-binding protein n=1 Tax=Paenibacillus daejeonensis TaxID=135193 RepID=UPI00036A27AD|nr:ABC transporter substrate-binding protein [Paenibacillus daejeonensis]
MKRSRWTIAVIVLVAALLTACGGGDPADNNGASPTPETSGGATDEPVANEQAAEPAAETPALRTIDTVMGEVEIPAEPERIVGLSVVYPELLYALDIVPVAVQNYHEDFPAYLEEPFRDVLKTGIAKTPNFEAILSSEPDLIIAPQWWAEKDYDQLSKIAPTVLLPERDEWQDELRDIAGVLGKDEQAEQVIEDLKNKEAQATARLDELVGDETVLYMRIMAKEIVIHGENISRGSLVHKQLGLKPLEAFPQSESALSISLEVLPDYDADHLIVQLDDEENEEVKNAFDEMSSSSLWKNMKAVQNGHVYMVGGKEWFNVGMAPLADDYAIDAILKVFEDNNA